MNIEEKAKAYDEVLEKVKGDYIAYKKVGDIAGMDAITSIFPQIAESEDEKFRKYIVRGCKEAIEAAGSMGLELSIGTTKKLYAYLEKQKEQKSA